jgi:hypothetical protein
MRDFFQHGFQEFLDPALAQLFETYPLHKIQWTDDGHSTELAFYQEFPLGDALLTQAQTLIAQKYITEISPEFLSVRRRIWTSFTEDQLVYHNDTYKETADSRGDGLGGDAPYNVLALLYLSDMTPYDEGAVWFRSHDFETRIVPKKGTLILVNCGRPEFQHRAEWTEKRRYLAQFGYKVSPTALLSDHDFIRTTQR